LKINHTFSNNDILPIIILKNFFFFSKFLVGGIVDLFKNRVFAVVKTIPAGKTMTYKDVARLAGNPKATRAVGAILRTNYDAEIPCHRVIRTDGSLAGYNRGIEKKKELLRQEALLL
jgi:O-6-methylguanine DNA methyltransferase